MPKNTNTKTILFPVIAIALVAIAASQIPTVNRRLAWRMEVAQVYLQQMIDPAGPVPTPLAQTSITPVPTIITATPTRPLAVTPTPPDSTPTPTLSPTPLPEEVTLPSPPYERQDMNNCGPASLSMYMRYYGWEGDQFTVSDLIKPLREDRNVNVEELVYYVRNRAGWLHAEFRVGGDLEILKQFLAAGIPVLVEESMQMDEPVPLTQDYWAAHYLLLTGYDNLRQIFTVQDSFADPDRHVSYQDLDRAWQAFNRVYILVYPANMEETVKSILGEHWDISYNRQHALEVAQNEIEADSENAFAWFNLGSNLVYFAQYSEAAQAYDRARNLGLPQRMMRYQFGPFFAYFHSFRNDELLALAEHALKVTRNSEEAFLWRGWGRFRHGDRAGAVEDFREALKANSNYLDAKYALDFIGASP